MMNIQIQKIEQSKIDTISFDNLGFGQIYTDHMLVCDYKDGIWKNPQIIPYQPFQIDPASRVFHYGQAVFEGLKAYKDEQGQVWMFRVDKHSQRLNHSCRRICMPEVPEEIFCKGLEQLVNLDRDWVQPGIGNSLYIRPFVIATEVGIKATQSSEYRFMIILSPAQAYFSKDTSKVKVKISDRYTRASNGGVGSTKVGGNYAAQFYPTKLVNEEGYDQLVWTSEDYKYLEESGVMNVFFRIKDTLITAALNDRILDGVTRRSLIEIAKKKRIKIEERLVSVSEVIEAAQRGTLKEAFGSGTAAVVSPIDVISYRGIDYKLPMVEDSYGSILKDELLAIQYNKKEDPFNWRVKVG